MGVEKALQIIQTYLNHFFLFNKFNKFFNSSWWRLIRTELFWFKDVMYS